MIKEGAREVRDEKVEEIVTFEGRKGEMRKSKVE